RPSNRAPEENMAPVQARPAAPPVAQQRAVGGGHPDGTAAVLQQTFGDLGAQSLQAPVLKAPDAALASDPDRTVVRGGQAAHLAGRQPDGRVEPLQPAIAPALQPVPGP